MEGYNDNYSYFDEETFLGNIGSTVVHVAETVRNYVPRIVPENEEAMVEKSITTDVGGALTEYLPGIIGFYAKELQTAQRFLKSQAAVVRQAREIFEQDVDVIKDVLKDSGGDGIALLSKVNSISFTIGRLTQKYLKLYRYYLKDFEDETTEIDNVLVSINELKERISQLSNSNVELVAKQIEGLWHLSGSDRSSSLIPYISSQYEYELAQARQDLAMLQQTLERRIEDLRTQHNKELEERELRIQDKLKNLRNTHAQEIKTLHSNNERLHNQLSIANGAVDIFTR